MAGRRGRQFHDKLGALARQALDGDTAGMGFDDRFDEAKPEPEPALGAAFVAAVEAVPDSGLFIGGNADAVVLETDSAARGGAVGLDPDLSASGGVFESVIEEIGEDLADAQGIDVSRARGGSIELNGDLAFLGHALIEIDDFGKELGEIDVLAVEFEHAGFGFGDVHERFEHAEYAIGFLEALGEGILV